MLLFIRGFRGKGTEVSIYTDWALIDAANPFVIFPVEFITPFVMIGWSIQVYKKRGISILEIFGAQIERGVSAWLKKIHA